MTDDFFEESTEQSRIKAQIVEKYFKAWTDIFKSRAERMAYIDLFAGAGVYEDGTKSTPILVLERALQDVEVSKRLIAIFNDADAGKIHRLQQSVSSIPNISKLRHEPKFLNDTVGERLVRLC